MERTNLARLDTLDFATQLIQLDEILNQVEGNNNEGVSNTRVTFWGTRVIQCNGQEFSLDEIADKVAKVANQCYENENLTGKERIAGIEIVRKINHFYAFTDTHAENANFFTKLIFWLRECNCFFGNRMYDMFESGQVSGSFKSYTEKAFDKAFPDGAFECFNPTGSPARAKVDEQMIAESLV